MSQTTPAELTAPPQEQVPYVIRQGGGRAHLLIDQVGRCLAGAEETGGAMSMMTLEGPAGRPIPLHYHNKEYEFFLCHRGTMQLWLDGESRILSVGDFGYAPPGTVHAYGLLSHHAGFVGPIHPGGWDRFFDLTGIPYDGVAPFPVGFRPEIPFAKFGQAEHDFDMKYLPDAEYAAPRTDAADDALPAGRQSYFLRAGAGPRHRVGGALVTTLIGAAQTDGRMTMLMVDLPRDAGVPAHTHADTAEGLLVLEGALRVWLDGEQYELHGGDYSSIPAGTEHSWEATGFFTRALSMTTPGGLEAVLDRIGKPTELGMVDRDPQATVSAADLADAAERVDLVVGR